MWLCFKKDQFYSQQICHRQAPQRIDDLLYGLHTWLALLIPEVNKIVCNMENFSG